MAMLYKTQALENCLIKDGHLTKSEIAKEIKSQMKEKETNENFQKWQEETKTLMFLK